MLQTLGTIALRLTALGSLAFVLSFALLAPWRGTVMGRHMMTFMGVITVIIWYVAIAPFLGPLGLTARLWIRLVSYTLLGAVIWWREWLFIAAQLGNLRRYQLPQRKDTPPIMDKYAKAVVGAVMAVLTGLGVALADSTVTGQEWVTMAIAGLGALGIVWAVPNEQTPIVVAKVPYDAQHDTE